MKRIISGILIIALLCTLCGYAFADQTEKYAYLPVEFQGAGLVESLNVMVKENSLYVDAEQLGSRLGYDTSVIDDRVSIYNNDVNSELYGFTIFFFDSTRVIHTIGATYYDYEAPFETVRNDNGAWIPLEYALSMLRSGVQYAGETALISMPQADITDYFRFISAGKSKIWFDYNSDFAIADEYAEKISVCSDIVNTLKDIPEFGMGALKGFLKYGGDSFKTYDYKYASELATMFCTNSNGEKDASVETIGKMSDVLGYNKTFSDILSNAVKDKDITVGTLTRACEALKKQVDGNSTALLSYNKTYEQLEKVLDSQTKLSNLNEWVSGFADASEDIGGILNMIDNVADYVNHLDQWTKQDKFAVAAIQQYLSEASMISGTMKKNITETVENLKSDFIGYTSNYITDNLLLNKGIGAVQDAVKATLSAPAAIALLAWDIASGVIPFYHDGLEAADKFELSVYGLIFQADAYNAYANSINRVASNPTYENIQKTAELCYAYLKAAYITRSAAIAYAENISHTEDTAKLVEEQNAINAEIAAMMSVIKSAGDIGYGFLPEDSIKCVDEYDDSDLIKICSDEAITSGKQLTSIKVHDESSGDITRTYDFTWDNAGRLSSVKQTDEYNVSIYTIKYDSEGRILSEIYGEPVDQYSPGNNSGTIYTYGDSGLLESELSWEGGAGETSYVYDVNKTLIKTVCITDFGTDTTEYSYNAEGFVERATKTSVNDDGFGSQTTWQETISYKYDSDGRCISEKSDSEYGKNAKYIYDYKPFCVETASYGDYKNIALQIPYNNNPVYSIYIGDNAQFYADAEGYLACITTSLLDENQLYEFYYNGKLAEPTDEVKHTEKETHPINISQEQAYQIACDYWNFSPGDIAEETGYELSVVPDHGSGVREDPSTGRLYYTYKLRWKVVADYMDDYFSTCDIISIDAETGECGPPR